MSWESGQIVGLDREYYAARVLYEGNLILIYT